jgi:DNA primase
VAREHARSVVKLRYSEFAHRLDIDALEEALEFDPIESKDGEDRGFCILPYNAHTNGDTTGKFSINREKKVYNCWVCGGGSLLDLAMATQDLEMEPAIKWLYQFANHEETDDEFLSHLDELLSDPADQKRPIPYFNARVLDRWSSEEHEWYGERGISEDVRERYGLRYAPLAKRTIKDEEYVGPSIILPHFWRGRLVGWQQRWLEDDRPRWVPKYTMTPDFPKNETLFGYDQAMEANVPIIVCESVPSVLFLVSEGYAAVATFGSSVDEAQKKLLRRAPKGVILAPDNDEAGFKWTNSLANYLENYISVSILPVLDDIGSDIGDLAIQPEILPVYLEEAYNTVDTAV